MFVTTGTSARPEPLTCLPYPPTLNTRGQKTRVCTEMCAGDWLARVHSVPQVKLCTSNTSKHLPPRPAAMHSSTPRAGEILAAWRPTFDTVSSYTFGVRAPGAMIRRRRVHRRGRKCSSLPLRVIYPIKRENFTTKTFVAKKRHPINEMMVVVECITAPQVRDNHLSGIKTKLKADRSNSSKVPADELGPSV